MFENQKSRQQQQIHSGWSFFVQPEKRLGMGDLTLLQIVQFETYFLDLDELKANIWVADALYDHFEFP